MGFGIRLTPTLPGGRKTAIFLQFLACLAYVIYMTIAGPFLIFHRLEGYKLLILVFFSASLFCAHLIITRTQGAQWFRTMKSPERTPHSKASNSRSQPRH